ncbi:MAG: polysaccharide biosynthesis/export family protein [Myxococcaceae bacterium]
MTRWPFLLLLSLSLLACRTPKATDGGKTISIDEASTHLGGEVAASTLGSGDLVEVRVFQEADLSNAFRVSPEGTIDFPLCGKVRLSGMTSSQAADALTRCLQAGYLKKPQVSVLIREYNSKKVYIFGEVHKPGTYPYDEHMTIIQAVTLAGGFTKLAAKNNVNVTRLIETQEKKIRVPVEDIGVGREKNFMLQPGDIVFVPESFF